MTVKEFLAQSGSVLKDAGLKNPEGDSRYIISEILSTNPGLLPLHQSSDLDSIQESLALHALERRKSGEPLQYILGKAYFRELRLNVGPGVLIPRPETEILAGIIIDTAPKGGRVLDVATGSGAISLSVAFERPDLTVYASDISNDALVYARKNQAKYDLSNVTILEGSLFDPVVGLTFDFISANLPYVTDDEYAALESEVKDYEPLLALKAGIDGLDIVRQIIVESPAYLKTDGSIILEIGSKQSPSVQELFRNNPSFYNIRAIKDLTGIERFVSAMRAS